MRQNENLFVTAMEECAELQQAISKLLRFGKNSFHPDDKNKETNEHKLLKEYYQLTTVINMLIENGALSDLSNDEIKVIAKTKQANVKHFQKLSEKLKTIQTELPKNYCLNDIIKEISKEYIPQKSEDMMLIFKQENDLAGTPDVMGLYFNPDAASGGQYVVLYICNWLIINTKTRTKNPKEFFEYLEENCYIELIDIGTENFNRYDEVFCKQENALMLNENNAKEIMDRLINRAMHEMK